MSKRDDKRKREDAFTNPVSAFRALSNRLLHASRGFTPGLILDAHLGLIVQHVGALTQGHEDGGEAFARHCSTRLLELFKQHRREERRIKTKPELPMSELR